MHCTLADLPPLKMLPASFICELISILQPEPTVNFSKSTAKMKPVSEASYEWFESNWPTTPIQSCKNSTEFAALLNQIPISETPNNIITTLTSLLNHPVILSNEDLMDKVTGIISQYCGSSASSDTVRLFQLTEKSIPIKILERGITADCIGWKTWGASLPFSKRLLTDESIFAQIKEDKKQYTILELGSGTGLAGITILHKLERNHNFKLYLTDLPEIVPNLEKNIKLNHPNRVDFVVAALDWKDHSSFIESVGDIKFDFVVVCDCLYSPEHPSLVVSTINQFLKKNGELLFELPLRPKFEQERNNLWDLLQQNGYVKLREENDFGIDDFGESYYIFQSFKNEGR